MDYELSENEKKVISKYSNDIEYLLELVESMARTAFWAGYDKGQLFQKIWNDEKEDNKYPE